MCCGRTSIYGGWGKVSKNKPAVHLVPTTYVSKAITWLWELNAEKNWKHEHGDFFSFECRRAVIHDLSKAVGT